jgi:hypothetical protein
MQSACPGQARFDWAPDSEVRTGFRIRTFGRWANDPLGGQWKAPVRQLHVFVRCKLYLNCTVQCLLSIVLYIRIVACVAWGRGGYA